MMYLAIAVNDPNHAISSAIVNICTKAKAYHVEPVFSDGSAFCCSPKCMGMITRHYDSYHWVKIPCPFITIQQEKEIRKFCDDLDSKKPKYDWLGAISGFFGSKKENRRRWYCGELCVKIFTGIIPDIEKIKWATPDKIWKHVAYYYDKYTGN